MKRLTLLALLLALIIPIVPTQAQTSFYNEAPMLTERVAAGELPPVDDRLPINPLLVQPFEDVGQYGAALEVPVGDPGTSGWLTRVIGYESLVWWDSQWLRITPNVAQSVDVSDDAMTYTFTLRQGMRWSDGAPFGADDILFWYEHVFSNRELTPRPQSWLSAGGMPVVVEKISDTVVEFQFAAPNAFFLRELANSLGSEPTSYPHHYLEQFHPAFNADAQAQAETDGYETWVDWFKAKNSGSNNPEAPRLWAWTIVERGDTVIAERNPYYWKIDTNFSQLPYLDRVIFSKADSAEALDAILENDIPDLIFQSDLDGIGVDGSTLGLRDVTLISSYSSAIALGLNLNHPDPVVGEFFRNKNVRIALSHSIDRQAISEAAFGGNAEPYQVAPRPESPFYNEDMAHQYTEYNVELANQLLDEAGYGERDAEGYRLAPDGTRVTFELQLSTTDQTQITSLNLIAEQWQALGLDVAVVDYGGEKQGDYFDLLFSASEDNYFSEAVGGLDVIMEPAYYFPVHPYASFWASGWASWYLDPSSPLAVEPPTPVQDMMALYEQLRRTTDADEQAMLMTEILDIAADEFLVIGTVLDPNAHMYVSDSLHNVPPLMPTAFTFPAPGPSNPAQYFVD